MAGPRPRGAFSLSLRLGSQLVQPQAADSLAGIMMHCDSRRAAATARPVPCRDPVTARARARPRSGRRSGPGLRLSSAWLAESQESGCSGWPRAARAAAAGWPHPAGRCNRRDRDGCGCRGPRSSPAGTGRPPPAAGLAGARRGAETAALPRMPGSASIPVSADSEPPALPSAGSRRARARGRHGH